MSVALFDFSENLLPVPLGPEIISFLIGVGARRWAFICQESLSPFFIDACHIRVGYLFGAHRRSELILRELSPIACRVGMFGAINATIE